MPAFFAIIAEFTKHLACISPRYAQHLPEFCQDFLRIHAKSLALASLRAAGRYAPSQHSSDPEIECSEASLRRHLNSEMLGIQTNLGWLQPAGSAQKARLQSPRWDQSCSRGSQVNGGSRARFHLVSSWGSYRCFSLSCEHTNWLWAAPSTR